MRCCPSVLLPLIVLAAGALAAAQTATYNLGRTPSTEEIRAWDISIGPSGKGLPPGSGSSKEGAPIYAQKCAMCHGPTGTEGQKGNVWRAAPPLVGGQDSLTTARPRKTVGSFWPFATSIWDYINRAMPRGNEGSLSQDEVYALTAFLLYRNGVIQENDVMDAKTLPKVPMPNRNGFVPSRWEDIRLPRCRLGTCP